MKVKQRKAMNIYLLISVQSVQLLLHWTGSFKHQRLHQKFYFSFGKQSDISVGTIMIKVRYWVAAKVLFKFFTPSNRMILFYPWMLMKEQFTKLKTFYIFYPESNLGGYIKCQLIPLSKLKMPLKRLHNLGDFELLLILFHVNFK